MRPYEYGVGSGNPYVKAERRRNPPRPAFGPKLAGN
jgi:hypothetical protein